MQMLERDNSFKDTQWARGLDYFELRLQWKEAWKGPSWRHNLVHWKYDKEEHESVPGRVAFFEDMYQELVEINQKIDAPEPETSSSGAFSAEGGNDYFPGEDKMDID